MKAKRSKEYLCAGKNKRFNEGRLYVPLPLVTSEKTYERLPCQFYKTIIFVIQCQQYVSDED